MACLIADDDRGRMIEYYALQKKNLSALLENNCNLPMF
jgi:hypothetical protein